MSLKGKVLIGAGVVLAIIVVGLFYIGSRLDSIVKNAVEHYGSEATGTRVSVSSVDLSLRDGRGTLHGLSIANPPGFSSGDAIRFGTITLAFDLDSLRGGQLIIINDATIQDPFVNYERNEAGKGNLETIQANIDRYRGPGSEETQGATGTASEQRFRIKKFVFEDGKIQISAPGLKEPIHADLPSLRMNDVGGAQGATPPEIGKLVLAEFARSAGKTLAREGLQQLLDKQLGKGAGEKARGLIDSILK